jgi:RNA polymerase sigma factor (sigma-70 family)
MEAQPRHRHTRAVELLDAHGRSLQRIARRYSLCPDDADDALQRAAEILLTKAPPLEPERLIAWMVVVTKHEALAVRRSRDRALGIAPRADAAIADPLDALPSELPGPRERAERAEHLREARRALASLKANERLAIVLQAEGFSYAEICELCGWTYTKVNRCLAEGRAALRARAARAAADR